MLVGCSDEPEEFVLPPASETNSNVPEEDEVPEWLEVHHVIDPADWILMRSQSALKDKIADKAQLSALIHEASQHFRDDNPRMVVNRAVQLEDMLLEIGIEKSAMSLIEELTHLPTTGTPHTFSAYCQYYFNMREQGHDHEHALSVLSQLK